MRMMMLLLAGCTATKDGGGDTSGVRGDIGGGEGPWSVVAEAVPGGVLLSAWSDGDTLRMVGGDLGGGTGLMVRWDGSTLCYESDIADRALWWIHGPEAGEWVAVGEGGTVLHSVDGERTRIDAPTDATFYGAWADGVAGYD